MTDNDNTPEPDAGDVETLAVALCDSNDSWAHHDATDDHPCLNCKSQAVDFLTSDWLARIKAEAHAVGRAEAEVRWMKVAVMRDGEAIREAKADAWDEGWAALREFAGDALPQRPRNPYRADRLTTDTP